VSEKVIWISCPWCEQTFEGDEADAASEGWFQLDHPQFEEPRDYCSIECLISDL
jgi:hypothetical protein